MKNLTLIHVTPAYKPAYCYGGPTLSVARLCEELSTRYPKLTVLVLTTLANGKHELDVPTGVAMNVDGVQVMYYKRLTKDHTHFSPALLWALKTRIKEEKCKQHKVIVHIHSWWNLVALLSVLLAKVYRIPLVISPRGMITSYTLSFRNQALKSLIHSFLGKPLLRNTLLHATSSKERRHIQQHCNTRRIVVLPNLLTTTNISVGSQPDSARAIASEVPAQIPHQGHRQLKILFLSRIDPKKGLNILLSALAALKFDWALTIAGPGNNTYVNLLKELAINLKINHKLTWLTAVDNERKYQLLIDHDLLALTSHNENFGNVILESLLVGTAVLVSAHVGLADYIRHSKLGWVCNTDAEEIAAALRTINKDVHTRNKIRQNAASQVKQDFNTRHIMRDYYLLYQKVLKQ